MDASIIEWIMRRRFVYGFLLIILLASLAVGYAFELHKLIVSLTPEMVALLLVIGFVFGVAFSFALSSHLFRMYRLREKKLRQESERALGLLRERDRELLEARRHAKDAEVAKSQFLATVSHELRTPLNGLSGATELMSKTPCSAEQMEYLDTISNSTEHLLNLIEDMLQIASVDDGRVKIERVRFDPVGVADSLFRYARANARKGTSVIMVVSPDIPKYIYGDPKRLKQLLFNLLNNAIKFTNEGKVTLRMGWETPAKDFLRIEVQDTGEGISAECLSRIFEPFSQEDSSFSRRHDGIGLGLSICKGIAERMGGKLRVRSVKGEGSTFIFTFPHDPCDYWTLACNRDCRLCQAAHYESLKTAAPSTSSLVASKKADILIVEDNPINRKVLTRLLQKQGFEKIRSTETGEDGVREYQKNPADIVLLDIHLPGIDGLEVARRIRALPDTDRNSPRILACTANAMEYDRERCLNAGMNGYLAKPIRLQPLREALSA